ncbi:MAG TPA: AHH domain-containing protein [Polyangium sp.]|nr:AHH domain-containing protein [Polyangium sp.]
MFAKAREMEAALKAAGKPFVPLIKRTTDETHHIVAHGAEKAKGARDILAKFGIDIDNPANGVYLPATKNSPNPNGSIVHSVLHTDKYYEKVELLLDNAKTQKDAIQTLQKIQRMLENGTF